MLPPVIKDVLVYFVCNSDRVPPGALLAYQFEFLAAEYFARWIIGSIDYDCLGIVVERRRKLPGINRPVGRMKRHEPGSRAGKNRIGTVILVKRLKHDDLVARVDDGHQGRHHCFGRSACHRYLALWIDFHSKVPRSLLGDRVAKSLSAPGDRVLVDVGHDGITSSQLDLLRRREIRKALGKVY